MKKWQVWCKQVSVEQLAGEIPWDNSIDDDYYGDYVEADTPEEAIENVMQWMVEEGPWNSHPEIVDDMVVYHDDEGNATGAMVDFSAEPWRY